MNQLRSALASAACIAFTAPVLAQTPFTMTFENIPKAVDVVGQELGSAVLGFYNGDQRERSQPWNTTFSPNALAICAFNENGNVENCFGQAPQSPGGGSYVATVIEDSLEFKLTDLFLSDLRFYYFTAAGDAAPVVKLTGVGFLKVIELDLCEGTCWLEFDGLDTPLNADEKVTSVQFRSTRNSLALDDIKVTTIGGTAIPEPSTYALIAMGLALLVGVSHRRTRATH